MKFFSVIFWMMFVCVTMWGGVCELKWQTMSDDKLVSSSKIRHILEDSEGYIWYATEGNGVCRDNGHDLLVFRSDAQNPDLLGSNNVNCLVEIPGRDGRFGQMLIGTYHGAYILDKNDYGIKRIQEVDDKRIDDICLTSEGHYWITANKKLYEFSPAGSLLGCYPSLWKGKSCYVSDIAEDSQGRIWVSQWDGGLLVRERGNARFVEAEWPLDVAPTALVEDTLNGCFWIGCIDNGVVSYRLPSQGGKAIVEYQHKAFGPEMPISSRVCISLQMDVSGDCLWMASMDGILLLKISEGRLERLPFSWEKEGDLNLRELNRLSIDSRGNILVAGGSGGAWAILRCPVKEMTLDRLWRDGCSWEYQERVGIVCTLPDGTRKIVSQYNGKMLLPYVALCRKSNGLWVTDGANLLQCLLVSEDSLSLSRVAALESRPMALADDGKGYVWMASSSGLSRISLETGETELQIDDVRDISAIALADDGTLWLASIFGQIYCYREGEILRDEYASLMQGDAITHMNADSCGVLWMQTDQYARAYHPVAQTQQQVSREPADKYAIHLKPTMPRMAWSEPPVIDNPVSSWLFSGWMWAVCIVLLSVIALLAIYNMILRKQRKRFLAEMMEKINANPSAPVHEESGERTVDKSDNHLTEAERQWLQKVMDFVSSNLANEAYGVEQLSSDMCVSRMTFYRKLQTLTGQKPSEFIRTIRLQHAAAMLKEGKLTVTEVSYATGFSSASYFSRCFRTMFGVPPMQFGKNMTAGPEKFSGTLTSDAGTVRKKTPVSE